MAGSVLAVIPARSGSKRVPEKNVRQVDGKPLIAHTIEQADSADFVDEAVVSTDSETIRSIAKEHGGNAPFLRPSELATDTAPSSGVVSHALDWFERRGESFDTVVLLQPTSPLRTANDIDDVVQRLDNSDATSVVTVSSFETPPFWAVEEGPDGFLRSYFDEVDLWSNVTRSQDVPDLHHPNGAVMAATTDAFVNEQTFYTERTVGHKIPPERAIDIDKPYQLEIVRAVLSRDQLSE